MRYNNKIKYIFVGGLNTILGYFISIYIYNKLELDVNVIFIGVLTNLINITISFFMYKIFVFSDEGDWLMQYLRSYAVYGSMAILSIFLLWVFVDYLVISIYYAQALIVIITIFLSYIGHSQITFNKKIDNE